LKCFTALVTKVSVRGTPAAARHAGLGQRLVQHLAGGTHERLAGQVFLIARLFPDQHHPRLGRPLARHALGGVAPKIAAAAELNVGRQLLQAGRRLAVVGGVAAAGIGRGLSHHLLRLRFRRSAE
jgi:hypothetical protein